MRKSLFLFISFVFCFMLSVAYAAETKSKPQIVLYAKPDQASTVVQKISPWQNLVPIYHQNGWIKVGNPEDGQIGWINVKNYQQIMTDVTKPSIDMETSYVQMMSKPVEKGQDQYKITGYKNGKPLTKKEAEALLQDIQKRQEDMQKQFQKMQEQMRQWFTQTMEMFDKNLKPQN